MDLARRVELIKLDSAALADAADTDLRVRIPTCPEWDMAALVRHILQVHRSWCLIVDEGRMAPDWSEAPMPPDAELVAEFRTNAIRFADVLGATDPAKQCWTWGPEQNAGFVQRFQVQEVALHRRDAEQAVGKAEPIAADGAADAIELVNLLLPAAAPGMRSAFRVTATDAPTRRHDSSPTRSTGRRCTPWGRIGPAPDPLEAAADRSRRSHRRRGPDRRRHRGHRH